MTLGTRAPIARRAGWMLTGVLATLTLTAGLLLPAAAASAAGAHNWAHLFLDDATRPIGEPYAPPNQDHSSGAVSTVTRLGTGEFEIRFVDVAVAPTELGVVHVTSAVANTVCQVRGTYTLEPSLTAPSPHLDARVGVSCRLANGNPYNARLYAFWTFADGNSLGGPGAYAYVVASEPATGSYTPDLGFASTGIAPTIVRRGTGAWTVQLTGGTFPAGGGTVQVTPYGRSPDPMARCHPSGWTGAASTLLVNVECYSTVDASPLDTIFMLTYARDRSLVGEGGVIPYGYARSDTPAPQYNSPGVSFGPGASGIYPVSIPVPGVPGPFNVQVTVIHPATNICSATGWTWEPGVAHGAVVCRTAGGSSSNTAFSVAFVGTAFVGTAFVGTAFVGT